MTLRSLPHRFAPEGGGEGNFQNILFELNKAGIAVYIKFYLLLSSPQPSMKLPGMEHKAICTFNFFIFRHGKYSHQGCGSIERA
jgi:hypothetical protein